MSHFLPPNTSTNSTQQNPFQISPPPLPLPLPLFSSTLSTLPQPEIPILSTTTPVLNPLPSTPPISFTTMQPQPPSLLQTLTPLGSSTIQPPTLSNVFSPLSPLTPLSSLTPLSTLPPTVHQPPQLPTLSNSPPAMPVLGSMFMNPNPQGYLLPFGMNRSPPRTPPSPVPDPFEPSSPPSTTTEDSSSSSSQVQKIPKRIEKFQAGRGKYYNIVCSPLVVTPVSELAEQLSNALAMLPPSAKGLGFFLSHKYTLGALKAENLKGSDRIFVDYIDTKKWSYAVLPVIFQEFKEKSTEEHVSTQESIQEYQGTVYAFTMNDFKYLNGKGEQPKHSFKGVPFIVDSEIGTMLFKNSDEGSSYTGNDSRPAVDDAIYFHGVIILSAN